MTSPDLEELQIKLQRDLGSSKAEWQVISNAIGKSGAGRDRLLRWIFADYKGYVDTRTQAGVEFVKSRSQEGWEILNQLATSSDPDDRDTALSVLALLDDPQGAELARPLLNDPYPYLQLEAAEFLRKTLPTEVTLCLERLIRNSEKPIADAASDLLRTMRE